MLGHGGLFQESQQAYKIHKYTGLILINFIVGDESNGAGNHHCCISLPVRTLRMKKNLHMVP